MVDHPKPVYVDPRTIGTWVAIKNGGRWVWTVDGNGAYRLHREAADGTPVHWATFSARNGHWTVQASTGVGGWTDGGRYDFQSNGVFYVEGKTGCVNWRRVD